MTHENFIKVVNHEIYINPRNIVKLDFEGYSDMCNAVCFYGNVWERVTVYKKDVEHLIKKEL